MKWFQWVAVVPVLIIGTVAIVGIAASAWSAMGWWTLIVFPAGMLWFLCSLASAAHNDRS